MAGMIAFNHPTISISDEVVRPTYAEINLDRLTTNYRAIEKFAAPAQVMPVLKQRDTWSNWVRPTWA